MACAPRWNHRIDGGYNHGYTRKMKTAISIPDAVFAEAERVAHSLGLSRSELYTRAVAAFLKLQSSDETTRKLDEVYADDSLSNLDPELARLQSASLDPW